MKTRRPEPPPECFGLPEELEFLSQSDYFGQRREYTFRENVIMGLEWRLESVNHRFSLTESEGYLTVRNAAGRSIYNVVELTEYENCVWTVADGYWIYGVRDHQELFRIDYYGRQYETLFYDGVHEFLPLRQGESNMVLADRCVLIFSIQSAESSSLCRLYLPTMNLEIIHTVEDADIRITKCPPTNMEFFWEELNPVFYEMAETEMNDPESAYYGESIGTLESFLSAKSGVHYRTHHYLNLETGESYQKDDYGVHSTRTPYNIEKNGLYWWKDDC